MTEQEMAILKKAEDRAYLEGMKAALKWVNGVLNGTDNGVTLALMEECQALKVKIQLLMHEAKPTR